MHKKSFNNEIQDYKGIRLRCRGRYKMLRAKRFWVNETVQQIWIPNKHLTEDGTIKPGENIDYVFRQTWRQCAYAGVDLSCLGDKKNWNIKKLEEEKEKNCV